ILIVSVLTLLRVIVELRMGTKVAFSSQFNFITAVYFLVQATLNILITILLFPILKEKFPNELGYEFVYSFLTVFGIEAFVRHTNITMYDTGILSVQDWLNKVKELALAETLEKSIVNATNKMHEKVERLKDRVDELKLDFHIKRLFVGEITAEVVIAEANKIGDSFAYKAWAIVRVFPVEADALIKNNKPKNRISDVIN
ncbi:hypothetical protein, partial [Leptospira gomenensis]